MLENENVFQIAHGNHDYLLNRKSETAVLLLFTVVASERLFLKKWNKKYKNPFDIAKRITTVDVVHKEVVWFLNNEKYKNYELVVSVGSHLHESCVFFRNKHSFWEAVYFNANFSQKTQGVQSSRSAIHLMRSMGKKLVKIESYWSPCHNMKGRCSYHTWKTIHNHLCNGFSPFENDRLNLKDYNHLMTIYSYDKYHKKKRIVELNDYNIQRFGKNSIASYPRLKQSI